MAQRSDACTKQKGEELTRSHDLRSHLRMRGTLGGVTEEGGLLGGGGALRFRGAVVAPGVEVAILTQHLVKKNKSHRNIIFLKNLGKFSKKVAL